MKSFLKAAVAAVPFLLPAAAMAVLTPTSASAQSVFGTNLTVNLEADVAGRCNASLDGATGTVLNIDFGTLSGTATTATVDRTAGNANYICNDADGFTRTITSANAGFMTLDGVATTAANRRIAYTLEHGGASGINFTATQLTTPIITNLSPMLDVTSGAVTLRANGVGTNIGASNQGTTVFAGDYSDVVTIAIAAR